MIVVDASIVVDYSLAAATEPAIVDAMKSQRELAAPSLIEYEIGNAFRRHNLNGNLSDDRAMQALQQISELRLLLFDIESVRLRAWQLRSNITFYDACYVALAEELSAPLYTRDKRLASAPGHNANIVLL